MADTLALELVSPESLLLTQSVEMVVVPGAEGDFGVRAGHAPMISNIRPCTLAVFEGGRVAQRFFLAGGFAEITTDRCTILAEGAVLMDDIDRAALELELRDLREDVSAATDDAAKAAATETLEIAEAKLQAIDTPVYSGTH